LRTKAQEALTIPGQLIRAARPQIMFRFPTKNLNRQKKNKYDECKILYRACPSSLSMCVADGLRKTL